MYTHNICRKLCGCCEVVYMYTPLCGTCQVASRMVDVLEQLLPTVTFERQDLNYVPDKAIEWHIESVPCLLIFKRGKLVKKYTPFIPFHMYMKRCESWLNKPAFDIFLGKLTRKEDICRAVIEGTHRLRMETMNTTIHGTGRLYEYVNTNFTK